MIKSTNSNYNSTTATILNKFDELARTYKHNYLSGNIDVANEALSELFANTKFTNMIVKNKMTNIDNDDYIQTVFLNIFMDKSVMEYWDDEHYSIIGLIKMFARTNGKIGTSESEQMYAIKPFYMKNKEKQWNTIVSTNERVYDDNTETLQDYLEDDATGTLEDDVLGYGELNEDSEIVNILSSRCKLSIFDTRVLVAIQDYKNNSNELLAEVRAICEELQIDETVETMDDVMRIKRRIRQKLTRGDKQAAIRELAELNYLRKEAI